MRENDVVFPGGAVEMVRLVAAILGMSVLLFSASAAASSQQDEDSLLPEIVAATVQIMRSSGYEMPDYRVINGGTDVPISGPPEKYAFFGYLRGSASSKNRAIALHFYEADRLPVEGRAKLAAYLTSLHAGHKGGFALALRMMKDRYRKGQMVLPRAFLEMDFERIDK